MITLRSIRGESDYPILASLLTASENADNLAIHFTGEELAKILAQDTNFELSRDLVIAELDGQPGGYGHVRWQQDGPEAARIYWLSAFVEPRCRRQGLGRALLAWLEAHARQLDQDVLEKHGPGRLRINATQYQLGLHALVKAGDYHVKESWVLMVRPSLEDIPELPLPPGIELRPALPELLSQIWYAVQEAYVPEGGPPPDGVLPDWLTGDPNFQPELWQVGWDTAANRVAGSVMTYINHAENQAMGIRRGYTEGISTVPGWRRRGLATALIMRSLQTQRAAGMSESGLVCSGENPDN